MTRFSQQRRRSISLRMSALGRKSQAAQSARRIAAIGPEELADMLANPPVCDGDAIGCLECRNFRTGAVSRWTVLRGERRDNYRLRTPDGRKSNAHGLSWLLVKLRRVILRKL